MTIINDEIKIFIIGAGGIVADAHLPAYRLADYPVAAIFDIDHTKAQAVADTFMIPVVYKSLSDMLAAAGPGIVYDIAVPGNAIIPILRQLPHKSAVLIQKPMGNTWEEAKEILSVCRERQLLAGVNFQLRYAPYILGAREMIAAGTIGEICSMDVTVDVYTPWHLWKFLYGLPRVEILYHSIHYIDLIRSFLGNPTGMYAKTVRHPAMQELAAVRSNIIMDYGEWISAHISTQHTHRFGLEKQEAYVKIEGTEGAIRMRLGSLMNYPEGVPDSFEYTILQNGEAGQWQQKTIDGTWFPHAFIGSMAQIIQAANTPGKQPDNSVEDCIHTMACVEAAYLSSEKGGTVPEY